MAQEMNTSGLKPLGRAVLVRMVELERLEKGLIEIPEEARRNAQVMEQRAVIVAVGAACWEDESLPRAAPGDQVIVTKMAGYVTKGPKDGKLYRLVNDRDVFCKVEES